MTKLLEKTVDFLSKRLRTRQWKLEAFKLCERCEKFYSFDPNACPYRRPHNTHCLLFVEVKRDKKDAFLRKVSDELAQKSRRPESKSDAKVEYLRERKANIKRVEYLRERMKKEGKYISWGWKFCPKCGSTEWEPAYEDRVHCKRCGKIFT